MPEHIRQEPKVLVSTENLTEQEWLAYRRRGIGVSDVAAILGISPFRTARDLYDDKLNIASAADDAGNWVALEMGHLLEPLVARIFAKKTGLEVFQIKKMFQHPQYPFMLADVDYFVRLPNGKIAILEIKTTNYNAKDHWWKDGEECVPVYYETQGRHYMTVMDIDEIFYCCLYGNNEDEVIIRHLYRDREYEQEMIYLEREFWHDHILTRIPPPYTEDGSLILESLRRRLGAADKTIPAIELDSDLSAIMLRYLRLQGQKQQVETRVRTLDTEMQRLKGQMVAKLGGSCMAMGEYGGTQYTISYNPVSRTGITKDNLHMCRRQAYDMKDKSVLFPKNCAAAHDREAERIQKINDAQKKKAFCMAYAGFARKAALSNKELQIVCPKQANDLVDEGKALHHCVGGYIDSVAEGRSLIVFVRRVEEPKKPYVTVEVRDGKIAQIHGDHNSAPTEEVQKFVDLWSRKVLPIALQVA